MHPLGHYKTAFVYVLLFLAGFLAAFLLLLALANGPSWIYIWRISGFDLWDKLGFIFSSGVNVIRFSGHIIPLSWLAVSSISGYMLAEYTHIRMRVKPKTYNHYSWLAPLVLVFGLILTGFSAAVLMPQANWLILSGGPDTTMATLVTLLGVTQVLLAAIYTFRWSKHIRNNT